MLVELEGSRILYHHLPDTLQKLCEDWRDVTTLASKMATPGQGRGRGRKREGRRGGRREGKEGGRGVERMEGEEGEGGRERGERREGGGGEDGRRGGGRREGERREGERLFTSNCYSAKHCHDNIPC